MILHLIRGEIMDQRRLLRRLADMQYTRNELDLQAGTYRVRGDVIDIFPAESAREAMRVELFDETIESLALFDPLTGEIQRKLPRYTVYPGSHYVTPKERVIGAIDSIREELRDRLKVLREQNKLVEAQRLEQRTMFDMEMMKEVGYCSGIENYSRYLSAAARPANRHRACSTICRRTRCWSSTRSHQTIPQLGAMYKGDRSRKETLVEYGFRLPSRARQPAAEIRGVGAARAADDFRVGDAGAIRSRHCGADRGAVAAAHASGGPGGGSAPGGHAGGRRAVRDQAARGAGRARVDHHAHQAHVGRSDRVPARARREGALPAFGRGDRRARGDHPRPAPRQVRRARGHQSAARRPRHARGVAGGHPRCRQGRFPAQRQLADPDHGPRGAPRERQGHPVCRPHHRFDAARDGRDRSAPQRAAGVTTWSTA